MIRHHVQIAGRIGLREICSRRNQPAAHGGESRGCFQHASGGAQRVPMHRLGGTDRNLVGVRAEDRADGLYFGGVIGLRPGAVSVDVPDVLRLGAGVGQRGPHS